MKKTEMTLTDGNLFKKIILYSLPVIFTNLLQLFYTSADLIVCRMFGSSNSTAAITSTDSLVKLIINLFMGLSIGANVLMARSYGQNDRNKAHRVMYTSMIASLVVGLAVGLFGVLASGYLLRLMDCPIEVIDLSTEYLKIYFIGLPFLMIYNFGAALLRATGDTVKPFIILALSGIVNVLFNLLFVIVFKMDVPGVALATIISEALSAVAIVVALMRNKGFVSFSLKDMRFHMAEALEIAKIGLPAGIQSSLFSLSNVMIQSSINGLGVNVTGGNGASNSLEGFIYTAMNSVSLSCVAFVSANYGAGNKKNILKSLLYSLVASAGVALLIGGGIVLFQDQLINLYVKAPEQIAWAKERLNTLALLYFICGIMDCVPLAIRGIGYSITPMIVSLIGVCGFRVIWIYGVFNNPKWHSYKTLIISYPITWVLTSIVHIIIFTVLFSRLNLNKTVKDLALE